MSELRERAEWVRRCCQHLTSTRTANEWPPGGLLEQEVRERERMVIRAVAAFDAELARTPCDVLADIVIAGEQQRERAAAAESQRAARWAQ